MQPCNRWSFDTFHYFKYWGILFAFFSLYCTLVFGLFFSVYDAPGTFIKLFWSGFVYSNLDD